MNQIPLWAQAESESVRALWVEAWGLLEEASELARQVGTYECNSLADRIDRLVARATYSVPSVPKESTPKMTE